MPLLLEEKQNIVQEAHEFADEAISIIAADYRGMTVSEMTEMRAKARADGVKLTVVRNTLARRAVTGTSHECIVDVLNGPTMLGFSIEEPGTSARLFREFVRSCPSLDVKGISIGGTLYDNSALDRVASLPTKDEAVSQLMSVMLGPVTKLAQTIQAVPTKLVRTLVAVKDAKESGS